MAKQLFVGIVSTCKPTNCGIAVYTQNLADHFNKDNVVLIGSDKQDLSKFSVNFKGLKLKRDIKRIVKTEGIEILHFQYTPSLYNRNLLNINFIKALKQKIPVICTMHEVYTKNSKLDPVRKFVLDKIQNSIVKNTNAVIVHSPLQKKYLEKNCKAKNVFHINHGITDYRVRYKKTHEKNLLSYGIIRPNKGLENTIMSMKYLKDYNLTIVGKVHDSRYDKYLRRLIGKHQYENIQYVDKWTDEKDKKKYYKNADIVLMPYSTMYGMSGVLCDAVGFERPVVTSNQEILKRTVKENKIGESAETSPEQLARAIKKVCENYASYENPIKEFKIQNRWRIIAKKHFELYKKIIKKQAV